MRTILLGRPITAGEALSSGLLCDVVDDDDDDDVTKHAVAAAAGLGDHGPEALQLAKEAICRGA